MRKKAEQDREVEAIAIDAIRKAKYFTATLLLGRGEYRIEERPTVLAAVQAAREMEGDPSAYTRRAVIYAVSPQGRSTLLTAALIEKLFNLRRPR
jgi:hypothetical protein